MANQGFTQTHDVHQVSIHNLLKNGNNQFASKSNLSSAPNSIEASAAILNGSRSTASNLRSDIQKLKEEHLVVNLNRQLDNMDS